MMNNCCLLLIAVLLPVIIAQASQISYKEENEVKTSVFLSPKIEFGAGTVSNKFYYNVDFPRGHIGLKSVNAELVDEAGNSVPQHETYIHHWVLVKYAAPATVNGTDERSSAIILRNSGTCQNLSLGNYYGPELRRTDTNVPDPYAVEVGNGAGVPQGYEERWILNVHAIDTRGVVDPMGCAECRCDLMNVTIEGYKGGLKCCTDQLQCRLKEGFQSTTRNLYLRYTVKWVDWVDTLLPVRVYILDVTDTGERTSNATVGCQVEYDVDSCGASARVSHNECLDTKTSTIVMPRGGDVVYAVAHQYAGAVEATLYGQNGQEICTSKPIYGNGTEAGNEAGYVVGMTSCHPQLGSIKIADGEGLRFTSVYNSDQMHTGMPGHFYLMVADNPSKNTLS